MSDDKRGGPMVKMASVYENVSQRGTRYFVAYLGAAKLVMLPARDAKEGEPGWTLYVQERAPKPAGTEGQR